MRFSWLPLFLQFTDIGTFETVWQVKFYNYHKRDHCQWGSPFSVIEYECKPNETRSLMWVNKESFLWKWLLLTLLDNLRKSTLRQTSTSLNQGTPYHGCFPTTSYPQLLWKCDSLLRQYLWHRLGCHVPESSPSTIVYWCSRISLVCQCDWSSVIVSGLSYTRKFHRRTIVFCFQDKQFLPFVFIVKLR